MLLGAPALVHLDDDADLPAVLYSMLHLWAVQYYIMRGCHQFQPCLDMLHRTTLADVLWTW